MACLGTLFSLECRGRCTLPGQTGSGWAVATRTHLGCSLHRPHVVVGPGASKLEELAGLAFAHLQAVVLAIIIGRPDLHILGATSAGGPTLLFRPHWLSRTDWVPAVKRHDEWVLSC